MGALRLRADPFGIGLDQGVDDGASVGEPGDALGDHPALVVERHEEQRRDDAFLVLEVVIDRADALAAGALEVVDRGRLDAVGVEQAQRMAQHAAPAGLARVGKCALEQAVHRGGLACRQIFSCHVLNSILE